MKGDAIILDSREFATKREAVRFFRQMLGKYEIGQMVDDSDHRLLLALVARHRHARDLLSRPVAGFRIARSELVGKSRRFEIVREDGSVNDFSYLKCISPPSDPHLDDVLWAMRCEVVEQTRAFHNEAFRGRATVSCGITGAPVKRAEAHVDHVPPLTFQVLVVNFLMACGLRVEDAAVTTAGRLRSCSAKYLADRELAAQWQQFHRQAAKLRITSKRANLEQRKEKVDFSGVR